MVEQEQFKEFGLVTISLRGQYILQMVVLIFIEIMSEWASFLIFFPKVNNYFWMRVWSFKIWMCVTPPPPSHVNTTKVRVNKNVLADL